MPTLLVVGASSDMGRATALIFAKNGWNIQLAGRNIENMQAMGTDISLRTGSTVSSHLFDALTPENHSNFWHGLPEVPDALLCTVGLLGEQRRAESDFEHADMILQTNFTGLLTILGLAATTFETRKSGTIIGISSVAGDRGRASNYVYGSAKAGLSTFLSGLRNRLARSGVHVVTVKPGFVHTAMTEGLNLPPLLTAESEDVGNSIFRAVQKKKNVVYVKSRWLLIMTVIKLLPEFIFKKTNL